MSTVRLLMPNINLVNEVIERLNPIGNDYSKNIIVFPGKRPAHVVRKKLSEKIGAAYIPPKIFSIDIFIEYLCSEHLGYAAKPIDEFDAVAILFELHSTMKNDEKIGKEHFSTLETFYPVGVKIYSELEELTIALISPKKLTESIVSVSLDSAHSLSHLYEPFYNALRSRGFSTRAMKYQFLAEHITTIDLSNYSTITLAGFFAFTQSEEQIVQHLLSLSSVAMLFQKGEGIRRTLDQLKLDPKVEGVETDSQTQFYESPDSHGQLFLLNNVLRKTFTEPIVKSETAAIILPSSENLFPLYHQTLSVYDQNTYNLALGYPLSRTPVYGFLISLLEVIVSSKEGEVYVPKYIQFLLHPYTKNILYKTRTDVTRMMVHAIEDDCLEHSARVFIKLDRIENNAKLIEKIVNRLHQDDIEITSEELRAHLSKIHTETINSLLHIQTLGDFAEACINVLQFINEHSTAHRHPYFHPFVETVIELLQSLKRSLLAGHTFGKLEHYLLFLKHCIESAEVPFTGTPLQGLQILGFLETRGLQFEHVFMIDVNDDVIPGKGQQDVLLPLTLREQLGLSTYRDQERIKAYFFDVLRNGAKAIHYFYINNSEKEQSRFIAQLQWTEQIRQKSLKPLNTVSQEYHIDLGTKSPTEISKSPETISVLKDLRFSSTALDTYLTCGLRFYYRYVLRLFEKNELSGDVEQFDIGKIVHSILFEYFSSLKDKTMSVDDVDINRLKRVIQENFQSFYGSTQFGEQFLTKRQVEKHLLEFLEQYQKPVIQQSSVNIEALEEKFTIDIDDLHFTGNADRIETRNDRTFVLDYKTGQHESNYLIRFNDLDSNRRETWKNSIGSVQLVLYVMIYSVLKNIPAENIVPAFLFLGKKDLSQDIEIPLFCSDEEMKEWYPKLKKIVLSLAREISDVTIPFAPTDDIKNDCPDCPYRTICGTQWAEKFNLY